MRAFAHLPAAGKKKKRKGDFTFVLPSFTLHLFFACIYSIIAYYNLTLHYLPVVHRVNITPYGGGT